MSYLSDEDYDFIYSRVPRVCVDLFIKNEKGEVLLTKRDIEPYKDHWHFPGGRIKFRETVAQAIQRILKGELGQEINAATKMLGFCEFLEEVQKGQDRHSLSLVHEIRIPSTVQINLDSHSKEFRFFDKLSDLIIPAQREFLRTHTFFALRA